LPQAIAQDDRDHDCLASFIPLKCAGHLNLIAVVRTQEVWTYEKQDNFISLYVCVNLVRKILTCFNAPVVPCLNQALTLKYVQLPFQLVPQRLVSVTIGKEDSRHMKSMI
jgi:hypothetical protein